MSLWSLAGHHASPCQLPVSVEGRQTTVGSGRKCIALLRKQNLVSYCLKMLLVSETWDSTMFYLTWKPAATPRGRLLFRLVPSGRSTVEIGASYWPTPSANDNRDRGHLGMPAIQRRMKKGKQLNLGMVVSDKCGALNPDWVEWLMGFPIGWSA